ncbi:hypothetical protein H1R20_g673, partial [Candolleomyces eurysporus]
MNLMIDGIALEEVPRYDEYRNLVLGLCREHSTGARKMVDSFEEHLKPLKQGLTEGKWHYGKDGTVFALALITGDANYYPTPVLLSGSCKAEKGEGIADLVRRFIQLYNEHPMGKARHGPILELSTDGEASFRSMRFMVGLGEGVSGESASAKTILLRLTGMNLQSGMDGLIGTCDPKHVFKRIAQMTRSRQLSMQIWDTTITAQDVRTALDRSGLNSERINQLLNPADKQNVPIALNLLQELCNIKLDPQLSNPSELLRSKRIKFFGKVASFFTDPFTNTRLSLSEQLRKLSTFIHLAFAFYRQHKGSFLGSATYADSMSIVKCILITVVRLQVLDPKIKLYIYFIGTDRIEGVFSHVRTQDHARNFDILQLGIRLVIGAEINRIYELYPDLYQGHVRRNMDNIEGVDRINPASCQNDVTVGSVDVVQVFFEGRKDASVILCEEFGKDGDMDWDRVFASDNTDFMRPFGQYVGSRAADHDLLDLLTEESVSPPAATATPAGPGERPSIAEPGDHADPNMIFMPPELDSEAVGMSLEQLPEEQQSLPHSKFFLIEGKRYYKSSIVAKFLVSDAARKVTMRPFRNAGMTMKSIMERKDKPWATSQESSSSVESEEVIANQDLGGILVRCGAHICLAVMEVLHFKTATGRMVFDVKHSEIDHTITVIGQIIELECQSASQDSKHWIWNRKLIPNADPAPGATLSDRDFTVTVTGRQFFPMNAQVYSTSTEHTWPMDSGALNKALASLWDLMEPESETILASVEELPDLKTTQLPYQSGDKRFFYLEESQLPFRFSKMGGNDVVECAQCHEKCKLRMMRNHVGKHILLSLRNIFDGSLQDGVKV